MTNTPDTKPAHEQALLDRFLCFSVYSAGLAFNRVYKPLLDRFGLTYPQYLVMVALSERADQTVGELGSQLHLESNTLTPLIKRLEAAGLVSRRRDTADERVVRVRLTDQGQNIVEELFGCVPQAIFEATGMDMAHLTALNNDLRQLSANLRDAG